MIPWLHADTPFPDVSQAMTEKDGPAGLLAAGADLSPARLLMAYERGIFPWFSEGQPILWWSTDPRMVLYTEEFVVSHSLKKKLKQVARSMREGGRWQVRFDSAFDAVMRACAEPRRDGDGTSITDDIVKGYTALHRQGHAHSSELWFEGELVGGAYGVAIGRMFYGESMFARVTDASKVALAYLVAFLHAQGVPMLDCQQQTGHLSSLGARPIARSLFMEQLKEATAQAEIDAWQVPDLY